jgi:hypothetical protein
MRNCGDGEQGTLDCERVEGSHYLFSQREGRWESRGIAPW